MTLYSKEQSSEWQLVAFGWSAYVMYQNLRPQQQDCHVLLERYADSSTDSAALYTPLRTFYTVMHVSASSLQSQLF